MKGSEAFVATIKAYLDNEAANDPMFAKMYANPKKSVEECVQYIFSEVQKSGCCGLTDAEVYNIAVDYYDRENVEVGNIGNVRVCVNHQVELTEAEIAEAKQQAIQQLQREQMAKMQQRHAVKKPQPTVQQPTLFGF